MTQNSASTSTSAVSKQVSRCCISFPHDLTCQILTNQSIKSGRRAWPTRDRGESKSTGFPTCKNWLIFRFRGQNEIKVLLVQLISTTYFLCRKKKELEPAIIRKLETYSLLEPRALTDTRRNPPNFRRIVFGSAWIYFVVAWQLWYYDVVMSPFLRYLGELLVNAEQEMDSARDCKYKFSINLVTRKPEYWTLEFRGLYLWNSVYVTVEHA